MESKQTDESEIWNSILLEAMQIAQTEPKLKLLVEDIFLCRNNIFESVAKRLSRKLGKFAVDEDSIFSIFMEAYTDDASIRDKILRDIIAVRTRDPACASYISPILYLKGFHSLATHRVSHWLWNKNRKDMAFYLQSLSSEVFGVDIHPAARFGGGIMLDHATSFVAGETSVVEDNVSILHEVTLGGTGNETGDRHPKVRSGVLIGAGAKLIGNIEIGTCAKIGAGSVVLDNVAPHSTVVGIPARPVSSPIEDVPCEEMNQIFYHSL